MNEINKCLHKVFDYLGTGYKEHIYVNAVIIELRNLNYKFQNEVIVPIMYDNVQIGYERADIVIYEPISAVLEFKAQTMSLQKKDNMQLKKYQSNLDISLGVLVNFGGNTLEIIENDTSKTIDVRDYSL